MQDEVTQEDAWRRFELWLFRECNEGTRRHLWAMFGLPIEEINNHGHERHALRYVKETLARHRHQAERETLARMEPVAWVYETEDDAHNERCIVYSDVRWPADDPARSVWTERALYALPPAPEAGQ